MPSNRFLLAACMCVAACLSLTAAAYEIWDFDPETVHGFKPGPQRNDIIPGELVIDPPTLENLGVRWFVQGDSNANATVAVDYRRVGDPEWRPGLPLLRINHEVAARYQNRHFRTGNLFAGSVLFLQPGTSYEIRLTMRDPDGGAPDQPRIAIATTRSEPQAPQEGATLHVYPPETDHVNKAENAFRDFMSAYQQAKPGDVIFLHAGTHPAVGAPYVLTRGGGPGQPIVVRGAGAGTTILQGSDRDTDLFKISGADHVMFEDLTLRRACSAITTNRNPGIGIEKGTPGASHLTVRRCEIEDVIVGIWTTSENSRNWYIADNIITGTDQAWYPRPSSKYMEGSHTGVNVYGQGHVVCYNRISRFSDSLAIANYYPPLTDIHKQAVSIDFYNNDLSFATDDTIEADYGCHNIRVYRNLCYNAHHALSVQPAYGGPIYMIRNVAFGVSGSFKWSMVPSGPVAYHNTLISARKAFASPVWSNGHLLNNLLLGESAMIDTGTCTPELSTMDYNGWHGDPAEEHPVRWTAGRADRREYRTLADFAADAGLEVHGMAVDYGIFAKAASVEQGKTYERAEYDLRLRPNSGPVDAGLRLPNVNDGFTGEAPDLGAYESGQALPHYGPRTSARTWH